MKILAKSAMIESTKFLLKKHKKRILDTLHSYWIPKPWFKKIFIKIWNFAMSLCQHIVRGEYSTM